MCFVPGEEGMRERARDSGGMRKIENPVHVTGERVIRKE
jgi:hypothetical protein